MSRGVLLSCLLALAEAAVAQQADRPAADHVLKPSPQTVVWGYFDPTSAPVLRIQSGETVEIETLSTSSPERLEREDVPPEHIKQSLRDIHREVTDRGTPLRRGGHILTGPIYVEGIEPGDVLEVRILSVQLASPFARNGFSPGRGVLPEDFPYARGKIVPLDEEKMVARFAPGIEIPLRPFFGNLGVAPPHGRIHASPPWFHGGNMDLKELVAGTKLFLPVHVPGALFQVSDGHAAQGNGEVDVSALETSLVGVFQFVTRKDMRLRWPRAETPTHFITLGLDVDLDEAAKLAVREMIDFLVSEKHLTRDDAYMLSSVAVDLSITQLVDETKGVHAMIPKAIFVDAAEDR